MLFAGALFAACVVAPGTSVPAFGQTQRTQSQSRIDVQGYTGDIHIDPVAQTLAATVKVNFIALDDTTSVSFELNNALALQKVTDDQDHEIQASRLQQDMSVRLSLPQPVAKGQAGTLTLTYDGKLTGDEESPVFGVKFAAIHPDFAYLMYPARWFPVNGYTTDRFSADFKVTVPVGYKVLGSGIESTESAPEGTTATRWRFTQASFPGSIAVVRSDSGNTIASNGINTTLHFRGSATMAGPYGEEFSRAMAFFTDLYGVPYQRNLVVMETEAGAPNGYAAPGLVFLSPEAIGSSVNVKWVANETARQWWEEQLSPTSRNHIWIENGMARYSELLYIEHVNGSGAYQTELHDAYVGALTVENPPVIQSARLEDYSPEFWALTGDKGAAVLNMLRSVMGDNNFMKLLITVPQRFAWSSISTDDFHKVAEEIQGSSLNYFFQEWIESGGVPDMTPKYTVLRVQKAHVGDGDPQPGFRVMGTITQNMELFRMPVTLHIETDGKPEDKDIEVIGTSSEFSVDTFGKPRSDGITIDPQGKILKFDKNMHVEVAIRKGEQHTKVGEYAQALAEYQKALDIVKNSSLAEYRIGEVYFLQGNWSPAADAFHQALSGDLVPKWTEVWSHIYLGWIFDVSDLRAKAQNEYSQALRTKDNSYNAQEEAQKYIDHPYQRQKTAASN